MKTMKMVKAMKKLKFWSRKKKKRRTFFIENEQPPPPPSCHFHHHYQCYNPVEPSAPPLPSSYSSWIEYDQTQGTTILGSELLNSTTSGIASSSQAPFDDPKDVNNVSELSSQHFTLPDSATKTSYQQYLVPNPAYGVPVAAEVRRERGAGAFGCAFAVGAHLIRCFFPCFHFREIK